MGLDKKEGATKRSLPVCELLCFTRLFAWFYEIFGLFEISLKHTLEGFAVASFVASHLVDGIVDMAKPAFVEKVHNIKENNNFFGTTFQSNRYELTITFNIF